MKLDIGCGDRSIKYEEDYIGIDIDDYQLRSGNAELNPEILGDARWLPIKDEAIDEVFSGACIGVYVGEAGFDEAIRVLKPGGIIRFRVFVYDVSKVLSWLVKKDLLITDIEPINYNDESFLREGGADVMIVDDVLVTAQRR